MHTNNTPLDRLLEELTVVAETIGLNQSWTTTHGVYDSGRHEYNVHVFVTPDFLGDNVIRCAGTDTCFITGTGSDLASAIDDALGKITQAAPQAVAA